MAAKGITSIEFRSDLGPSPASTHRPSGKVWVNSSFMGKQMRKPWWEFILDHEEGHIVLDTRSEFVADAYAATKFLNKYPNEPYSMVQALTEVLPMDSAEQRQRVEILKQRAAKFDCQHNGKCNKPNETTMSQYSNFVPSSYIALNRAPGFGAAGIKGVGACQCKDGTNCVSSPNGTCECCATKANRGVVRSLKGFGACQCKDGSNCISSSSGTCECCAVKANRSFTFSSFNPNIGRSNYHIDGWGGLSPIDGTPMTHFDPDYEISNFTNCSKYIIPSRRKNCEAENQRERDAQIVLANINNRAAAAVGEQQADVAGSLGSLLAGEVAPQPAEPAKAGNSMLIIVVLIGAAISIGAVLYFMGKKPA